MPFTGCMDNFLDLYPEDKISSANFPENEAEVKLLLNGVYSQLRETTVFDQGLFGFGVTDGATPKDVYKRQYPYRLSKLITRRLSSCSVNISISY